MNSRNKIILILLVIVLLGGGLFWLKHRSTAAHPGGQPVAQAEISEGYIPDPVLTPGVVRTTDLNQICNVRTSTIRNVSSATKRKVYRRYGMVQSHTGICADGCEVDHRGPIECGFSNDIENLWPQPYHGTWNAKMKDKLENKIHEMMCSGQISVADGQAVFLTDWRIGYQKYMSEDD